MSRKRSLTPDIAAFKEVINMKYKTEKYIAVKNNTQRKFQARWKLLFIDKYYYDLLYHRLNYCFLSTNYVIDTHNGIVFCKLPMEIKMWGEKNV